jgi:hypothetical protein
MIPLHANVPQCRVCHRLAHSEATSITQTVIGDIETEDAQDERHTDRDKDEETGRSDRGAGRNWGEGRA